MSQGAERPRVAIVGGGLAGLSAAEAAVRLGARVELFEARSRLAGRAGSSRDPHTGQWLTNQHVALACCTELWDFCRRLDLEACFERHSRLAFLTSDGRNCPWQAAWWLPAPLHLLPSFLGLRYLTRAERFHTIATLARLACAHADPQQSMAEWLGAHGCSAREQELFWVPVLAPALGELPDRLAVAPAAQVFREAVLGSRRAYHLLVPRQPLVEIFDHRAGARLAEQGVVIHRGARVQQIAGTPRRVTGLVLTDGEHVSADAVIVAIPWRSVGRLFDARLAEALPELSAVEQIPAGAIASVHLWFDRPLLAFPHAALPGRLSQWIFRGVATAAGHDHQVVISAAHRVAPSEPEELLSAVLRELADVFPPAREARLLHHRVVIDPAAVFVLAPGVEQLRPPQRTAIPNLFLAGDWTRTAWPATMEGAIRSGRQAVREWAASGPASWAGFVAENAR
jgi:squalene-associated FAD-dependent desaturase